MNDETASDERGQRGDQDTGHKLVRGMIDIQIGALVGHHQHTYRVTQVLDFNSVIGVDVESGRPSSLAIKELEPITPTQAPGADVEEISDSDWQIAQQRFAAIQPLVGALFVGRDAAEKRAKQSGVDIATLYRWIQRYQATFDVSSLIPKKRGWRDGRNRIKPEAEGVVTEVIDSFFLTKQRPSVQKTVNEVQRVCAKRQIKPPSNSTIRARIMRVPDRDRLYKRGFEERAKNRYQARPGQFPGADYPLAVVQMDHTPADLILVDDTYRRPIGRPWITVAIDVYSRMIVGVYVSFDAPSETSVAMCLAQSMVPKDHWLATHGIDAAWPVWGAAKKVYVDNGSDFRSDTLLRSCLPYGIQLEFRKVKTPHYGGHIERLLGTLLREIHALPGTTFSSIKDKEGHDPDKHAAMTLGEFETWLLTLICKLYHQRPHSELGMSPLRKWEIGIFGNAEIQGIGMPKRPADPHTVLLDFLPIFDRTVQPVGVTINGLTYYAEALRPWINAEDPEVRGRKQRLIFRRDPRDISLLWFRDPKLQSYYRVPFANLSIPSMSIWEYRSARERLAQEGKTQFNDTQLVNVIEELREKVEASKEKTKHARRASQRRKEHGKAHQPFTARPNTDRGSLGLETPSVPPGSPLLDGDINPFGEIA